MKTASSIRSDFATKSHDKRTRSHPGAPLGQRLAARGIRLTAKRKMLLKILEEADRHLDAAALLRAAQKHMEIDRATVYRTLDLLKREGLIDELDLLHLRGEMHYYEARTGKLHFHVACYGCGKIQEIALSAFGKLLGQVSSEHGFRIETARLEIGGYCPTCAAKAPKQTG